MVEGLGGGLFTLLFLWGLWEWSQKKKREKSEQEELTRTRNLEERVNYLERKLNYNEVVRSEESYRLDEDKFYSILAEQYKDTNKDDDFYVIDEIEEKPDVTSKILWTIVLAAVVTLIILGVVYFG